jgi:CRISPR-associated endonuclease/helicase Cas3
MLYSCLVDADFLDTERVLDKSKTGWRSRYPNLSDLIKPFWSNFDRVREASKGTKVSRQREVVLSNCLRAAKGKGGLFSLTVPTGGGKTLASLAFALEHAHKHNKRRIIYVIPFTSIIEQNASVFRAMLGDEVVLEHHCNFIPDDANWTARLAIENWDAPIVVTTNVQFFDSFYSRKPSKCRKLHNVVDSVVIFDEVQAIPVEKLMPCLEVIRELSLNYKVTALLCTATQPAIHFSEVFLSGLKGVREIVHDVPELFKALKRTKETFIGTLSQRKLAEKLGEHRQVLCVVNTRQQALDVFNFLPESEENIHLSALMYPAHRSRKLADIRNRIENGSPCKVVSTQLIEAGVDVDFRCGFRSISGIDSIAQAAGRCNRNGRSEEPCPVFVFKFPDESENSFFRKAAQSAQKLFEQFDGNLTSPDCVNEYFLDYFWKNQHRMDEDGILDLCHKAQKGDMQFKDIADFQMIKTATLPIVVAIEEEAVELIRQLEFAEYSFSTLRRLQKYSVQIYPYQLDVIRPWLENPYPGIWVLRSAKLYSEQTGLKCKPPEGCAFFG